MGCTTIRTKHASLIALCGHKLPPPVGQAPVKEKICLYGNTCISILANLQSPLHHSQQQQQKTFVVFSAIISRRVKLIFQDKMWGGKCYKKMENLGSWAKILSWSYIILIGTGDVECKWSSDSACATNHKFALRSQCSRFHYKMKVYENLGCL